MGVVLVKFKDDSSTYPYKTFYKVDKGDKVIVYREGELVIAEVVYTSILGDTVVEKADDYIVQTINTLPYEHYTEKYEKLYTLRELGAKLSSEELDDIIETLKLRYKL